MRECKLHELSLDQLTDIMGEHFADNFEAGKHVDAYANQVTRHVVGAMHRKHKRVFLGRIACNSGDSMWPIHEWWGGYIPSFSADFAVPVEDMALVDLITAWAATGDVERLFEIHTRIEQIGGVMLHWFSEAAPEGPDDKPKFQVVG